MVNLCYGAGMKRFFALLLASFLLASMPAIGQQRILVQLSSGTGFFINRDGKIITNAHVVRQCKSIIVRVPEGELPATLTARDDARDLAVLKVSGRHVPALASLRWNINELNLGDEVVLLGYPGQEGAAGHASFVKTKVNGLVGPNGEAGILQLDSVARQGNSGGPVLDTNGNVIAVITGKAQTYKTDAAGKPTGAPIRSADIAITLEALQDFLRQNQVSFYQAPSSGGGFGDRILQENAAKFIVPIRCIQGTRHTV